MKQKGFTIVELLFSMSVILLLSSIILVSFSGLRARTRIAAGLYFERSVYSGIGAESLILLEFDEGAGVSVVEDVSGYNNHGTIHGPDFSCASDDPENTPSGIGCSLDFNGINNYVEIPHSQYMVPSGAITISFWLYLKQSISCSGANNWRSILYKSAGKAAATTGYDVTLEDIRIGGVYAGASLSFDLGVDEGDCGNLANRARYGTWGSGKQYHDPGYHQC